MLGPAFCEQASWACADQWPFCYAKSFKTHSRSRQGQPQVWTIRPGSSGRAGDHEEPAPWRWPKNTQSPHQALGWLLLSSCLHIWLASALCITQEELSSLLMEPAVSLSLIQFQSEETSVLFFLCSRSTWLCFYPMGPWSSFPPRHTQTGPRRSTYPPNDQAVEGPFALRDKNGHIINFKQSGFVV